MVSGYRPRTYQVRVQAFELKRVIAEKVKNIDNEIQILGKFPGLGYTTTTDYKCLNHGLNQSQAITIT